MISLDTSRGDKMHIPNADEIEALLVSASVMFNEMQDLFADLFGKEE